MTETTQYYDMASLSEASYVLFDQLLDFSDSKQVEAALKNKKLEGNFSATQAADFVANWQIVAHQENTTSGFSATLFKKIGEDQYYYACRGTELTDGGWQDLIKADLGDIVTDGLAMHQIVDMYNDWQRIKAPKGEVYKAVTLVEKVLETGLLLAERLNTPPGVVGPYQLSLQSRNDVVIDMPTGVVYTIVKDVASDYLFSDERAYGAGITITGEVTAVGHSLGGHLADSFSRLFSECSDVFTVNGAGYMTGDTSGLSGNAESNIRNLFEMLNGADHFDSSKILNLYGDKWIEFTSMNYENLLVQQGGHQKIYIESASSANVAGHSNEQMTDSFAVYDLFIQLDPSLQTTDFETVLNKLTPLFYAIERGRDNLETYENIANAFGDLFVDNYNHISNAQWTTDRDTLYQAIQKIRDAIKDKTLTVDSLVGLDQSELVSQAQAQDKSGLAIRYALVNCVPFVFKGDDTLYDKLNTNGELDLYDRDTKTGDLSPQYIEDRSKLLYHLTHPDATVSTFESDIDFVDNRLGISLEVDNGMNGADADRQYLFGNLEGELLESGSESDHLYGMAGEDILNGGTGADYLEGGADNDTYILVGDGRPDTVFDIDKTGGVLKVGDQVVSGECKGAPGNGMYYSVNNQFSLKKVDAENWELFQKTSGDYQAVATLKDWQSGQFGIMTSNEEPDYIPADYSYALRYYITINMT